jgi:hypothetical protein
MSKDQPYSLDHIAPAGTNVYMHAPYFMLPTVIQALLSSHSGEVLHTLAINGMLIKPLQELKDYFLAKGGRLIMESEIEYVFIWKDSYVDVHVNKKDTGISIHGYLLDANLHGIEKDLERDFISRNKTNLVFTIIKNPDNSLDIRNMGDGSSPLIKDNYLPEVLEDIDFVIKSFQKKPPAGRICILNGDPGVGKTHLIRSILMRLDCVFLIVPSNMIDSLDKPEFMPLLLDIKDDHEKPIIMIIEDGDICLVPRKNDNISSITSLLNLSDGILGTIMDIKMIISTNADIDEMDQAILRPGRLCKNIHVGSLEYEQANRVYRRLMQKEDVSLEFRKRYTLAEIYDKFNNIDLENASKSQVKQVIGFGMPLQESPDRTLNSVKKIGF